MVSTTNLGVFFERSPPNDDEMIAIALVDMTMVIPATPAPAPAPAPPLPPPPPSPPPYNVTKNAKFGVLLPTWYLSYDDAIRETLGWGASQVPFWAVVCSDHDLTGAVTPLCDRSTPTANKTDKAIAQLRRAGVHILHYVHSRKLYWPNGSAEGCKPHCECCDSLVNVTQRVDEVLRLWPEDGLFIDNVNGSRALEGYYSAVYNHTQRRGPREVILNMGDRYRNWSWLFDYASMIVGAETYVAQFSETTSLVKRDFDYFRFSQRLAALVYDDKPTACNASECWKQYVDLAIDRGFTKIWFQGSSWQTTYWRTMVEYLRSKNQLLDLAELKTDDVVNDAWVCSGDGLQLGFNGSRLSALSVGGSTIGRAVPDAPSGFSLLARLPEVNCTDLLQNGDFALPSAANRSLPEDWAPYGLRKQFHRTTDPAYVRASQTAAVLVMNMNNSATCGLTQTWKPAGMQLVRRFLLSGWSKVLSVGVGDSGRPHDESYSLMASVKFADGSTPVYAHVSFNLAVHGEWQWQTIFIDIDNKWVSQVSIYALFRDHIGTVLFSELFLGIQSEANVVPAAFIGAAVSVSPVSGDVNSSSVVISAVAEPAGWNGETVTLQATFTGRADHIRCDGTIVAVPRAGQKLRDRAMSLRFSLPLDDSEWHTFGAGQRHVGRLGNAVSEWPLFVIANGSSMMSMVAAIPMDGVVYVHRIEYNSSSASKTLDISFDFGLSMSSFYFPAMATFSFVLAAVTDNAGEPFRAGVQRYYDIHPQLFDVGRLREQGAWLPFLKNVTDVPDLQDFGLKYHESLGTVRGNQYMNTHGMDILAYLEPGLLHWPLPHGMALTYDNLNRAVSECVQHPERYGGQNTSQPLNLAATCRMIAADAILDQTGKWFFVPETSPWNDGAYFYSNLQMDTVGKPVSRARTMLGLVQDYYRDAAVDAYSINGIYIDGAPDGSQLIDYNPLALETTRHPPVFDTDGRVVVLGAHARFSFLKEVAEIVHDHGHHLMGNGLWGLPLANDLWGVPFGLPELFDIAGTETNWQTSAGVFSPPSRAKLTFNRAMSGSGPCVPVVVFVFVFVGTCIVSCLTHLFL
jgi:hypothetical protein